MLDFEKLCEDYGIDYELKRQWIRIKCPNPSCGSSGKHGGFNLEKNFYFCWKCGRHTKKELLMNLLSLNNPKEAFKILFDYDTEKKFKYNSNNKKYKKLKMPEGLTSLTKNAHDYLKNRGFIPEQLIQDWKIASTGKWGSHAHRIFVPIYYQNQMISWLTRSYLDKEKLRYKTCPAEMEIIPAKNIVYGIDHVKEKCIVVEGVFDVWKLGFGAVATFGCSFSTKQLDFLKKCAKVYVLYDNEIRAQRHAKDLCKNLAMFTDVENIVIENNDPGSMSLEEAHYLKNTLLSK